MANDINTVTISGRLVRDPELKSTNGGTYFTRVSLASNHSVKKGDTWESVAGFFDVVTWKHTAEYLHKYAKKGDMLIVSGALRWSSWEKDGVKHSKVEITAEQVIIKPKRGEQEQSQGVAAFDQGAMADDDIPF